MAKLETEEQYIKCLDKVLGKETIIDRYNSTIGDLFEEGLLEDIVMFSMDTEEATKYMGMLAGVIKNSGITDNKIVEERAEGILNAMLRVNLINSIRIARNPILANHM